MDLTLKQIIGKIDDIHCQINNLDPTIEYVKIKAYLLELQNIEKKLSSVYLKASNVYKICSNTTKSEQFNAFNNSWTYLNRVITPFAPSKQISCKIPLNVKIVNNINSIPNTPLYWVENINQFAIHINGVIFRGNVGNIYNQSHIKKNTPTNQTIICKHNNKCKTLLSNKLCKCYHDPMDILKLVKKKQITRETYEIYKNTTRNFINTSWLYTEMAYNKKNIMMRHFGSKNTLKHECDLIKIDNSKINEIIIDNYRHQTMHDILVIMGLNQNGLLKEYPDLNMRSRFYDNSNSFSLLSEC